MKIAQIAPLAESVPPKLYGGTERVVSYLTEELVRLGHEVTLFASGDSQTAAELVGCSPRALRLDPAAKDPLPRLLHMLEQVRSAAARFDVLHFHVDHLHLPMFRGIAHKTVTTLHGRLDLPGVAGLYGAFADMPLVSVSNSQRAPLPHGHWLGNVYHGLPPAPAGWDRQGARDYAVFIGRVSPEKRLDRAIDIARAAGVPLRIAAKVDVADVPYFRQIIQPRLNDPGVEFIGEVNGRQKADLLGNAAVLLFPIDWPEPFGLAMIEAMSYGTPVVAWHHGAVPEVVDDGETGFIVSSVEEAIQAVPRAAALDRRRVQKRFAERFTAERMTLDYVALYQRLLARHKVRADDSSRLSVSRT